MSLIKPKPVIEKSQYKINVTSSLLEEIHQYCEFVKFSKADEFFEEAAWYVISKDKDFREWKRKFQAESNGAVETQK